MAKRRSDKPRRPRRDGEITFGLEPSELSLEEILDEYRAQTTAEESAPTPEPEGEPLRLEAEEDGVLTGEVSPELPEETAEETVPAEEPMWDDRFPDDPEAYIPREERYDARPLPSLSEDEIFEEMFTPEELKPIEPPTGADMPQGKPREDDETVTEGFEDDADFYAGPVDAAPETEKDEGETGEEPGEGKGEPAPASRKRKKSASVRPAGGLWEKLTGLLAAASFRREQKRAQPAPEPENNDKEMPADKAAKHYASQLPALKLRSIGAAAVCLLLVWITLGSGLGGGLPGRMATDVRLASLVALVAHITVLLLGLDVVTAGITSLFRGRPGAESLIVLSSIASIVDTAVIAATGSGERGIPYLVIPSAAIFFALRGGWHMARGCHDTFLTLFHSQEPCVVTAEDLPERKDRVLIKSRRDTAGFIRRAEEPTAAEMLSGTAFFPMAAAALALSLAIAVGSGDMGAFFHVFALMTALCAAFGWLYSFPVLFSRTARHLMLRGSALAGWAGARDAGKSRRLVLTDTDIFPEDTVEITGVRLLDKTKAQEIISYTGSMLTTAGTGTASVFTELMRRQKAALQQVEDFSVGEGGCKGTIQYQEIRVGTVGYMHLSGVKIPDKLRVENAIYTAVAGELAGVFLFRYRPMASVQRALYALRKARRKPIFAVRDFNLDPLLLKRQFGVSTEGFEFPPFAERYRISGTPAGSNSPIAGIIAQDGLETLVDLSECGTQLFQLGRLCAWICLGSAVLGAALMLAPCWLGNWTAAAAWRVLLYMLLWLAPTLAARLVTRK